MKEIFNIFGADSTTVDTSIKDLSNVGIAGAGDETTIGARVGGIISAVIGVLGLACVIIIIIGGVQYMTSSGDSGKVKKAKDTILYGVIGMVICVLAFAITQFVIGAINA